MMGLFRHNKLQYYSNYKDGKEYPQVRISFRDKKIVSDLIDKGCVPNKTFKISFPYGKMTPDLYSHFIRGVMDGDGNLGWNNITNKINFKVGFAGTKSLLDGIKHEIGKDELKLDDRGNCFYLGIDGNHQLIPILNYIYKDSYDEIELTRKRERYNEFLEFMENKYGN